MVHGFDSFSRCYGDQWRNHCGTTAIMTVPLLRASGGDGGISKLQVAILARSSREMSQTVHIDWKHNLSRVRVSIRPRKKFIREKHPKLSRIPSRPRIVYLNEAATGHCLASVEKGALTPPWLGATDHRTETSWTATVVSVCACECACPRACVLDVFATYDNKIWPRLIMRIITIIILYFIQITHTDDFLSTGTRLVPVIQYA